MYARTQSAFARILAAAALTVAADLAHADFTGKVIAVLDGDTADVLVEQRPVRVRLAAARQSG